MASILSVGVKVADLVANDKGYANINVAINDEVNQWGQNVSAWNQQSKEERDAKSDRKYVGNGKVVFSNDAGVTGPERKVEVTNSDFNKDRGGDDLPF
jgi:hypothetical protein